MNCKRTTYTLLTLALLTVASACSRTDYAAQGDFTPSAPIWPDYMDVTIPSTIAPLEFSYTDPSLKEVTTTFSAGDLKVTAKGRYVRWNAAKWSKMLQAARGSAINVSSSTGLEWKIFVSEDEIDYGLNYRLIAPGYEVYSKMGIYERELASYREKPLIENTQFFGCVNCHAYNRGEPTDMSLHIRGDHGATILRVDGKMGAFNTKTDSTLGACVYPYWHPEGDYIAYSTNNTRQGFHMQKDKLIEVFDLASDLQVYDVRQNCLITVPELKKEEIWETFPAFSPDGRTLYFCAAQARPIPSEVTQIRYNLCSVSFDAKTGTIGTVIDTLVFAEAAGKSVSFPKPSYDGKYLMYTLSDYGQFSIWHHEADLWLLDLSTGETHPVDEANSSDTESYHNWNSNSRWFVFGSRRDNGLYTRAYICHMDEQGNCAKPFMLPQRNPAKYYSEQDRSFNVPEFVTGPVKFDKNEAERLINSPDRIPFGYREHL